MSQDFNHQGFFRGGRAIAANWVCRVRVGCSGAGAEDEPVLPVRSAKETMLGHAGAADLVC